MVGVHVLHAKVLVRGAEARITFLVRIYVHVEAV
jgi:hypothetical protein